MFTYTRSETFSFSVRLLRTRGMPVDVGEQKRKRARYIRHIERAIRYISNTGVDLLKKKKKTPATTISIIISTTPATHRHHHHLPHATIAITATITITTTATTTTTAPLPTKILQLSLGTCVAGYFRGLGMAYVCFRQSSGRGTVRKTYLFFLGAVKITNSYHTYKAPLADCVVDI